MKIAFISSVMGLGSYLWMNYKIDDELSNEEAGMGDLLSRDQVEIKQQPKNLII